jgi:hypothetical protein
MQSITNAAELKNAIQQLEQKRAEEWILIKQESLSVYESLQPVNIIKKTFKDLTSSPDFKKDLLGSLLSIAVGLITKKTIIGSTHNPLKQVLGSFLQMGVTDFVSQNAEGLKSITFNLLNKFFGKKEAE